jgi:hypoxanthine-guanine phosphoribosyltransferase
MSPEYPPNGWEVLYSGKEIESAIVELVKKLLEIPDLSKKPVILMQILESARVFTEVVKQKLLNEDIDVKVEDVPASSYRGKPGEQSDLKIGSLDHIRCSGEEIVFVVDDMVDTGLTMSNLIDLIKGITQEAPVFSVVLLEKISSKFSPDYSAIICPGRWVAGFGINGNRPKELGKLDGRDFPDIIASIED